MKAFYIQQIIGFITGLFLSLIYCAVAGSLPLVQQIELDVQDSLIRFHKLGHPPKEILLVKLDQSDLSVYDLHNLYKLNFFYAELVKRLMANGASVAVLNLPEQMKQYIDTGADTQAKRPLQALIRRYSNQVVLVARPSDSPSGTTVLNTFNNLLPFDDENLNRSIAPEQLIGYFRYVPRPHTLDSPARTVDLVARFGYEDDLSPNLRHSVKSVSVIALEKFFTRSLVQHNPILASKPLSSPVHFSFWGPTNTFPSLHFQLQCPSQIQLEECYGSFNTSSILASRALQNKLVIVDLPEGKTLERYSVRSPYGELSIAEVQANLIASLMTHSIIRRVPTAVDFIATAVGICLISLSIVNSLNHPRVRLVSLLNILLFWGMITAYVALSLIFFWQGLMLPLTIPVTGWIWTGLGSIAYLTFKQSLAQRQKLAERQAVLLQTRKLFYRVASDIHDGPLQDLKLVMDSLEFFSIQHPALPIDSLLNQLEAIGLALRDHLSSTRTIAEKLDITPDFQFGLTQGMELWLSQLTFSGELTLNIDVQLQPLKEPKSDSAWFDAREDIFRFFREAVTNVIRHAQPPNGMACRLSISLSQQRNQCRLSIANDGVLLTEADLERLTKTHKSGGYGTKLMTTIAQELPNGYWKRIPLKQGGVEVILEWTMDGF